jgi:hypothetical protein
VTRIEIKTERQKKLKEEEAQQENKKKCVWARISVAK